VHRSKPNWRELPLMFVLRRPFRCHNCGTRFTAFGWRRPFSDRFLIVHTAPVKATEVRRVAPGPLKQTAE
jgi:hypothetical protein